MAYFACVEPSHAMSNQLQKNMIKKNNNNNICKPVTFRRTGRPFCSDSVVAKSSICFARVSARLSRLHEHVQVRNRTLFLKTTINTGIDTLQAWEHAPLERGGPRLRKTQRHLGNTRSLPQPRCPSETSGRIRESRGTRQSEEDLPHSTQFPASIHQQKKHQHQLATRLFADTSP